MRRRIVVLGTLVGMLALGLIPGSANAAFPGANGKIVFSRVIGGSDQEIFTMDPNGTGVHQLTHGIFNVTWPTWSPDGTRILADGIVDSKVQLFVMNEDGSGLTQLTHFAKGASQPDWLPNGKGIVFVKITDPATQAGRIATMRLDGTHLRLLTPTCPVVRPRFSPTGMKIAFTSAKTGSFEIYVMNRNGKHVRELTFPATGDSGDTDWSPNGRKLVFESDRTGQSEIYTMNADGTGVRRLTFNSDFDGLTAWSPDGTMIAWSRAAPDFSDLDIWEMNANGSGKHDVHKATVDFNPDWQPL